MAWGPAEATDAGELGVLSQRVGEDLDGATRRRHRDVGRPVSVAESDAVVVRADVDVDHAALEGRAQRLAVVLLRRTVATEDMEALVPPELLDDG